MPQNEKLRQFIRELAEVHSYFVENNELDKDDWHRMGVYINWLDYCKINKIPSFSDVVEVVFGLYSKDNNDTITIENKKYLYLSNLYNNVESMFDLQQMKLSKEPDNDVIKRYEELLADEGFREYITQFIRNVRYATEWCRKTLSDKSDESDDLNDNEQGTEYFFGAKQLLEQLTIQKKRNEVIVERAEKAINDALNAINDAVKIKNNIEDAARRADVAATDAKAVSNSIVPNSLTAIGIFMAILTAIASTYLTYKVAFPDWPTIEQIVKDDSVCTKVSIIPQVKFAFFILAGQILTNIIFSFMFMLSRILDRDISVKCSGFKLKKDVDSNKPNFDCRNCMFFQDDNHWTYMAVHKYPYIWYPNVLMILGYIVLFIWWYFEKYVYECFKDKLESSCEAKFIILLVLISFLVVATRILLKKPQKKSE